MVVRDFTPDENGVDAEVDLNIHHLGFCLVYVPVSPKGHLLCQMKMPPWSAMDGGLGWKRSIDESLKDFEWLWDSGLTFRTIPGDQVVNNQVQGELKEDASFTMRRMVKPDKKEERSN